MSGECERCSEHCLDCKCKKKANLPASVKWSKGNPELEKKCLRLEENHLLELIYWARRYCDGRSTYAPSRFNWLYEYVVQLNPQLKEIDQFDQTLTDKGKYWPYAQDGMFNEKTGAYDARPIKPKIKSKIIS